MLLNSLNLSKSCHGMTLRTFSEKNDICMAHHDSSWHIHFGHLYSVHDIHLHNKYVFMYGAVSTLFTFLTHSVDLGKLIRAEEVMWGNYKKTSHSDESSIFTSQIVLASVKTSVFKEPNYQLCHPEYFPTRHCSSQVKHQHVLLPLLLLHGLPSCIRELCT